MKIILFGIVATFSVMLMLMSFGKTWQANLSESEVIYARPLCLRLLCCLYILLAVTAPLGLRHAPKPMFWFAIATSIALLPILLFGVGPSEVSINFEQHEYFARSGWLIMPHRWSGSLNDIIGVSIVVTGTSSTYVFLKWARPVKTNMLIGIFYSKREAKVAASELAHLLHIPIVPVTQ